MDPRTQTDLSNWLQMFGFSQGLNDPVFSGQLQTNALAAPPSLDINSIIEEILPGLKETPEEKKRREFIEERSQLTPEERAKQKYAQLLKDVYGITEKTPGWKKFLAGFFGEGILKMSQAHRALRAPEEKQALEEYKAETTALRPDITAQGAMERARLQAQSNILNQKVRAHLDSLKGNQKAQEIYLKHLRDTRDADIAYQRLQLQAQELDLKKQEFEKVTQPKAEAEIKERAIRGGVEAQAHRIVQMRGFEPGTPEYADEYEAELNKLYKLQPRSVSTIQFTPKDVENIKEAKIAGIDLSGIPNRIVGIIAGELIKDPRATLSKDDREIIENYNSARMTYNRMYELAKKIIIEQGEGRLIGLQQRGEALVGLNPEARQLLAEWGAFLPEFARARGERGNLAEQEQIRQGELLPRPGMTLEELELQKKRWDMYTAMRIKSIVSGKKRPIYKEFKGFASPDQVSRYAQRTGKDFKTAKDDFEKSGFLVDDE